MSRRQDSKRPRQERTGIEPFPVALARHDIQLVRKHTHTLQINVGLVCNQLCKHCHLDAGPHRSELMDRDTMAAVVACARRCGFEIADITGGAPELNPHLEYLLNELAPVVPKVMLRSNLTTVAAEKGDRLLEVCRQNRVTIIASLPTINEVQAEAQRGSGVFARSLKTMQRLNEMGYGIGGSGLELHLVSNPTGAFLPAPQAELEKRFRQVLAAKWNLSFNNLYSFANVPLGRFRQWLEATGNLEPYLQRLVASFNPCALEGVMCRTLVSVAWNGYLYDCDFNLAVGLPLGGKKMHVEELGAIPPAGSRIAISDHCYTCTAGAGFT